MSRLMGLKAPPSPMPYSSSSEPGTHWSPMDVRSMMDPSWDEPAASTMTWLRLLGNVVISKIILRTRKIMVMHSNERGECCPRTLVDRKRKRYDNAVDVVVRLHGPTDQAPKLRHLRVLAHVQLDDDPQTLIQQSVGDEFRQHDGVVTMMMFYRRRASPKLRDDMTEVEYGGGGHRTRLRNDHVDQLVCPRVPPCPRI